MVLGGGRRKKEGGRVPRETGRGRKGAPPVPRRCLQTRVKGGCWFYNFSLQRPLEEWLGVPTPEGDRGRVPDS